MGRRFLDQSWMVDKRWISILRRAWDKVKALAAAKHAARGKETIAEQGVKADDERAEEKRAKHRIKSWDELTVDFIDDETVRYKVKNEQWKRANYAELGFSDKRKGLPNKLWVLFRTMAQHCSGGYIDVKTPGNIQKDLERICDTLKRFFGPSDRPIRCMKKEERWQVKFRLSDMRRGNHV